VTDSRLIWNPLPLGESAGGKWYPATSHHAIALPYVRKLLPASPTGLPTTQSGACGVRGSSVHAQDNTGLETSIQNFPYTNTCNVSWPEQRDFLLGLFGFWRPEGQVVLKRRLISTSLRFVTFQKNEDLVYNVAYVNIRSGVADIGLSSLRKISCQTASFATLPPFFFSCEGCNKEWAIKLGLQVQCLFNVTWNIFHF
jgi:hypothetical protein